MSTGGVKTTNTLFSGQEVVGTIETWEILLKQNYKTKYNNSNKTQTFFTAAFFFFPRNLTLYLHCLLLIIHSMFSENYTQSFKTGIAYLYN